MIELYTFLSLLGIGYLLSKTSNMPNKQPTKISKNEIPSMNSIYDSSNWSSVLQTEQNKAAKMHLESLKSEKVIGPTFREQLDFQKSNKTIKSTLAGVEIPESDFVHNNMVPFFGSRTKQNVEPVANRSVLEKFTGEFGQDIYQKKKEQKPLFELENNAQNVFGHNTNTDYLKDRIFDSRIRNNERPFEPIRVGPGLDDGYSSAPKGGFQQFEVRDFAIPKTVEELRAGSNPKQTYQGRVLPGMGTVQRGKIGHINKNKNVVTFKETTPDDYFTTTGAVTRESERPEYEVKDTSRTYTTREYKGDAFIAKAHRIDTGAKEPTRQQLTDFGFRNIDGEDYGKGHEYDYGKKNILQTENERDITVTKTYEGNITSLVKSIVAPLQDIFRNTRKEYTVHNQREYGQFQRTFPQKITIKDPNDVTRTTIKETLIHDTIESGNIKGAVRISVYDPNDIARRTTRETMRPMDTQLNIRSGVLQGTLHNNDKPQTTIKETTIDGVRSGNIESLQKTQGGYKSTKYDAKLTQKQFVSDNDYFGGAERGQGDGYTIAPAEAPDTQKQFISDNDYVGTAVAGENKKPMSYEDIIENASMNELRELTLEGREPTKESVKVSSGAEDVNMNIKKLDIDEYASRETHNIENIIGNTTCVEECNLTKQKDQLDNDDRLDINILSSLKNNPYAINYIAQ